MQTSARRRRHAAAASLVLLLGGALGLAACSSGSSPGDTTSTTQATTTSTTAASTTTTSAPGSTTTTSGTLVPQTPTQSEFLSPSGNISCEIDNNFGGTTTSTLCLTLNPARSVTLKLDGTLAQCTGQQCLSNAGTGTPTLQYGQSITLGPFTCSSSTSGIKCVLGNGDGFLIASSGVTPLGNAKVTST